MTRHHMPIKRILCPTDFSDCSKRSLARAVRLARWLDARLTVLHVFSPTSWTAFEPAAAAPFGGVPVDSRRILLNEEAKTLEQLVEPLRGDGVSIETQLAEGSAVREILAQAETISADLIVMGKNGGSGLEHLILGSVTEKIVRRASCPVLVEGNARMFERIPPVFRRIVCAADLTKASDRTLKVALSVAEDNMARMTLLHVVEQLPRDPDSDYYDEVPAMAQLGRQFVEQARQLLERTARAAHGFCDVSARVETGRAWEAILRTAQETYADLIMIGAHTGGSLGRLLGSTASHVLRLAHSPVLVIGQSVRRPIATTDMPVVAPSILRPGQGERACGSPGVASLRRARP